MTGKPKYVKTSVTLRTDQHRWAQKQAGLNLSGLVQSLLDRHIRRQRK